MKSQGELGPSAAGEEDGHLPETAKTESHLHTGGFFPRVDSDFNH